MADRPLDTNTRLAVERTYLAAERTMMAWIRTSISLIGFGFTIFKFSEYLIQDQHHRAVASPWVVGITMIVIGLIGLVLAWRQHRAQIGSLLELDPTLPTSLANRMSGLIALLGVLALVVVVARL